MFRITGLAMFVLATAFVAAIPHTAAAEDGAQVEGVKQLYGFEIDEVRARLGKRAMRGYFVGKAWKGGIGPGWRTKDHVDELKLPENHEGPVTVYANTGSRDRPIIQLYRTGATEGKFSKRVSPSKWGWRGAKYASEGNPRGAGGQGSAPPLNSYCDRASHFFQRELAFIDDALAHRSSIRDWSAYDRLRIDVYAKDNPVVLGVLVQDSNGPSTRYGRMGNRTELVTFNVPGDKQVTLDFPLADMAKIAELDMTKAMGFLIQLNGFKGKAEMFFDNIRLVTSKAAKADARHPLIAMEGAVRPFARKVIYKPTERFPEKMKRKTGPVEQIGPIDIKVAPFGGGYGHFGGSGCVYFQNTVRGCVAYDNDRLCLIFNGARYREGSKRKESGRFATASFDGGKTWGGLMPGEKDATRLKTWCGRATISGDLSGDLYLVGTENCASYHEGYDTLFRRLAFTGKGWVDDRVSVAAQNMRKCPGDSRAWRLPSGRIWLTWCHGGAGAKNTLARYSDDDGYTWSPCKDPAVTQLPRPFYQPKLEDLIKSPDQRKPPASILLWPSDTVVGSTLLPYNDGIAIVGRANQWQIHDGENWGPKQQTPIKGKNSVTILGRTHVFIAKGGRYSNASIKTWGKAGSLIVADFKDGKWNTQTLEPDSIHGITLAASRMPDKASETDAVFCFYVKAVESDDGTVNEVRYRRWKAGKWGESVLLASEKFAVNHVIAPAICPPDYVAIFWDELKSGRSKEPCALRFMRIPNK